jgi:hypothetical protein
MGSVQVNSQGIPGVSVYDGSFQHPYGPYKQCKLASRPPQRIDMGGKVKRASVHGLSACAVLVDGTLK